MMEAIIPNDEWRLMDGCRGSRDGSPSATDTGTRAREMSAKVLNDLKRTAARRTIKANARRQLRSSPTSGVVGRFEHGARSVARNKKKIST
jgi:hypothetical protein